MESAQSALTPWKQTMQRLGVDANDFVIEQALKQLWTDGYDKGRLEGVVEEASRRNRHGK